jgi:hypothetical protein
MGGGVKYKLFKIKLSPPKCDCDVACRYCRPVKNYSDALLYITITILTHYQLLTKVGIKLFLSPNFLTKSAYYSDALFEQSTAMHYIARLRPWQSEFKPSKLWSNRKVLWCVRI